MLLNGSEGKLGSKSVFQVMKLGDFISHTTTLKQTLCTDRRLARKFCTVLRFHHNQYSNFSNVHLFIFVNVVQHYLVLIKI